MSASGPGSSRAGGFGRVLYLATNFFDKGGIARYCRTQIDTLRQIAGEGNLACLSLRPAQRDAFEEPFHADFVGTGARIPFIWRALTEVRASRPDLIWSNHVKLLPLGVGLGRLAGRVPSVGNVYGLELWSGLRGYERWALRHASHVVPDCHSTAKYVTSTLGVPGERTTVIWDPVDTERFAPDPEGRSILERYGLQTRDDACYLMTLGRVVKESRHKGYDRILDIMRDLRRSDLVYIIAGDGDDRPRLEERVRSEGLEDSVYFLGSVHERDLAAVYNAADLFVLVSDKGPGRGEGVPLTLLEAAACGKPIVAGDEDGSPEAVVEGRSGFVVSPRDMGMIRERIVRLADDPVLRSEMGEAGRDHVARAFSLDAFRRSHEELLARLREDE